MAKEPLGKLIRPNRGGTIFPKMPFGNRGTLMVPRFPNAHSCGTFRNCLRRISRNQPNRASAILHRLLSREENTAIRTQVTATIDDDKKFDTAIVDGVARFIHQHRAEKGGVASLSANEAVKSAIMACVMPFFLDQRADLTKSRVADRLDIRRERIDHFFITRHAHPSLTRQHVDAKFNIS